MRSKGVSGITCYDRIDWPNLPILNHWNPLQVIPGTTTREWPLPHEKVHEDSTCVICSNYFGPEGFWSWGSCTHCFHVQCLIPRMLFIRRCPICSSPFHRRLYEVFGLISFMPSHWRYSAAYFAGFVTYDEIGKSVEWSWKHNVSVQQLYIERQEWNWMGDKDNVLLAANLLYPNKPPNHGMKLFFYQVLGYH